MKLETPIKPISVCLVEPNSLYREGFSQIIKGHDPLDLVFTTGSAAEAFEFLSTEPTDILITTLSSTDWDAITLMERLKTKAITPRVIISEKVNPGPLMKLLIRLGIGSYFLKDNADKAELLRLINQVYLNGHASSSVLSDEQIVEFVSESTGEDQGLSTREREVLILTCNGLSRREIAQQLFVTESTVKFHLDKLRDRFNCQTIVQLVVKSMKEGIVTF